MWGTMVIAHFEIVAGESGMLAHMQRFIKLLFFPSGKRATRIGGRKRDRFRAPKDNPRSPESMFFNKNKHFYIAPCVQAAP